MSESASSTPAAAATTPAAAKPKCAKPAPDSAKTAPAPAPQQPFGLTAAGTAIRYPFQPSVASLAFSLTPALTDLNVDLDTVLPLPRGLSLIRSPEGAPLQLAMSPFFASKIRRVYGYVAEISPTSGEGAETPAQPQLATRAPWRYGRTAAERESSRIIARMRAFVSKALFDSAARVAKLGPCVCGFAEPSSGAAKSFQVVGWDVCSLEEWRTAAPASAPTFFDLSPNRIHFLAILFPP